MVSKNRELFIGATILVALIVFVMAVPINTNTEIVIGYSPDNATSFFIVEDVSTSVNMSVNMTGESPANITQFNVTMPSGFTYTANTNETNSRGLNNNFSSVGSVISWWNPSNASGLVNGSNFTAYFQFNVTPTTPGFYNFSITYGNSSGAASEVGIENVNLSITVNDTTVPVITSMSPSNGTAAPNGSAGQIVLSCGVTDNFAINSTHIIVRNLTGQSNIVNSSATYQVNGTNRANTTFFNLNLSSEGIYTWECNATDQGKNLTFGSFNTGNSSGAYNYTIIIDGTAPTNVTLINPVDGVEDQATSINFTFQAYDALSPIDNCTLTVGGLGSQIVYNVSETTTIGLTNGSYTASASYSWNVQCYDSAGNSKTSSTRYFTVADAAATTSTSSGGGSAAVSTARAWTMTYNPSEDQIQEGYDKQLKAKERMKMTINEETHYVGVKSLTDTSALIEIASDPIEVSLNVGGETKIDIDEDGVYDLYIKLNSITGGKADVTVKKISEIVPEEEKGKAVSVEGGEIVSDGEAEEKEAGGFGAVGIIVIILLIVAAIGGGVAYKKKQQ